VPTVQLGTSIVRGERMVGPWPIVENERLLDSALRRHPEFQHASVCSCGKVLPTPSMAGHIGGSNRKWTIKAKFAERHEVVGHTLIEGTATTGGM